MGSLLRRDKIGTLSESGGNINLGPSIITIGGRQFETTSITSVALPSLTANSIYRVYAVIVAGVPALVVSANSVSTGPVGYSAWLLIGHITVNYVGGVGAVDVAVDGQFANLSPIEARFSLSSAQTIGNNASTKLDLDSVRHDSHNIIDAVTNHYITIPRDGYFNVNGSIGYAAGGSNSRVASIWLNGSGSRIAYAAYPALSTTNPVGCSSDSIFLNAGDTIELQGFQDSGGNLDIASFQDATFLMLQENSRGLVRDEDL